MQSQTHARRVLWLSTVAFTLLFAVWLMLGVLGVPIKKELHLSPVRFSWLTAAAVLSGSIFRLPAGVLADRIGGRKAMVLVLLLSAIPCYWFSRTTSFAEMIACALCFGIAGNSFAVGIAWNAAWYDRKSQGFALGTFGAGNVGASVTKLIGPGLIALVPLAGLLGGAVPGGWRFIPVFSSARFVWMAAVVWFFAPTPDLTPSRGRSMASMLAPLREIRVWRFGLYYVVVFGAYVALSLWLPNYYVTVFGYPLAKAAMATAFFIFPASLLRPLGGWLSDRYGARPVTYVVFGALLLALTLLGLPAGVLRTGPLGFFVLIEMVGVAMGIGKASVYRYLPDYFPNDVGLVGGLVGTLGALGGFFLPLGFGYAQAATQVSQSCFWVIGAIVVVSFVWLHAVVTRLKRTAAVAVEPAVEMMATQS